MAVLHVEINRTATRLYGAPETAQVKLISYPTGKQSSKEVLWFDTILARDALKVGDCPVGQIVTYNLNPEHRDGWINQFNAALKEPTLVAWKRELAEAHEDAQEDLKDWLAKQVFPGGRGDVAYEDR